MGRLKNVSFAFNNSQPFKPGENISGNVRFSLEQTTTLSIHINFYGICKAKWNPRFGNKQHRTEEEIYFNDEIFLLAKEGGYYFQGISLSEGSYSPAFQYQLPNAIPSSFCDPHGGDDVYGKVVYTVTLMACFRGAFISNQKYEEPIKIFSPVPCPTDNKPVRIFAQREKHRCGGMCTTDSLKFEITVANNCYNPQDAVVINGYVINESAKATKKVKLSLVQVITYRERCNYPATGNRISRVMEWRGEKVNENSTLRITNCRCFVIPQLPASTFPNCQIIDVKYYLQFQVDIPGCSRLKLDSRIPVFIGNISSQTTGEAGETSSATLEDTQESDHAARSPDASIRVAPRQPSPPSYSDVMQYSSCYSTPRSVTNLSNINAVD